MDLTVLDGHIRARQWREALVEAQRLLVLFPTNAKLHWYEGMIYFANETWSKAEVSFRRAVNLDPNFSAAGIKLAQVLYRLKRYEDAFAEAKHWQKLAPNDNTNNGLIYNLQHQVQGGRTERWEKTRRLEGSITFTGD